MMMGLTQYFSPYSLNPLEVNPLRDVVRARFDFERIRRDCPLKLFIAATRVRTGKVRLFTTGELTEEAVLASACLPTLHHAVEIDGEAYWDGGFTANPAVYPLIYDCTTSDILLVLPTADPHADELGPQPPTALGGRYTRIRSREVLDPDGTGSLTLTVYARTGSPDYPCLRTE